jgi:hypothetical protein
MAELYIVRLFDGFDFIWMDVTEPMLLEEAEKKLMEYTGNGSQ